jgi:uncharacterized protein with beta-barrel porin domain
MPRRHIHPFRPARRCLLLCVCALFSWVFVVSHAFALDDVNPGGGYGGAGDWTGTADNDNYINNGTVNGDIDMTQGGSDTVTNSGTGIVIGDILGSEDGGNSFSISGTVGGDVYGSLIDSVNQDAMPNEITISGSTDWVFGAFFTATGTGSSSTHNTITLEDTGNAPFIYGSYNAFAAGAHGGHNLIEVYGDLDYITGAYTLAANSYSGGNTINFYSLTNAATNIVGSRNFGVSSSGGGNTIRNYGVLTTFIMGSVNFQSYSSGGNNTIYNYGTVGTSLYGSQNGSSGTSGGGNTIVNSGTVGSMIYGSNNSGAGASGSFNTITNAGTVGSHIYGNNNTGAGASGGSNTITNSNSVGTNIFGSMNQGSNSSGGDNIIENSGTVGNSIYGSYNNGSGSSGGDNTITNSGTIVSAIYGSTNLNSGSIGGDNTITNSGSVGGSIWGSNNSGDNSSGGSNTITNSGTIVSAIYGSTNLNSGSIGGDNTITNSGTAHVVLGSNNNANNSVGMRNTITNSGEIYTIAAGSRNAGDNTSGGSNTISNSGIVYQGLYGSANNGAGSTGGENRITNSGSTGSLIFGSDNYGDGATGGDNHLENSGQVGGAVTGSMRSTNYSGAISGSNNYGDSSSGGSNSIVNSGNVLTGVDPYIGFVGGVMGSLNAAASTSGGDNTIRNTSTGYVEENVIGSYNLADGTQGSGNSVRNAGQVGGSVYGTRNAGDNSSGGSNTVTNSGTVLYSVYGSRNEGDNSSGGDNTVTNSGSVKDSVYGTRNAGDSSSGGANIVTNSGKVSGSVYGTRNAGNNSSGGDNTVTNSGTVSGSVYGTRNAGNSSSGGDNTVTNSGTVSGSVYGSDNQGAGSSGGSSSVTNSGAISGSIYGNNNVADNSSSGSSSVTNSGTVTGDIFGSDNTGDNSSSGASTITNSGTVGGSIHGSRDQGAGSSSSDNSITNSGSVGGSILAGQNNDTVTIQGGSDVTGTIDGQAGTDALIFQDMSRIAGGQYRNFETMHLQSGTSKLTGTLDIANSSNVDGSLFVNGVLNSPTVGIGQDGMLGGAGTINGTVTNNGAIAPGNSIGTLTVNGDVTFAPGSRFEVELGIDGSSDLLYSTGAIDIQGGTLDVELERGLYTNAFSWRIMHADGGLSGGFDFASTNSLLLTVASEVSGLDLLLSVQRRSYGDFALTPPQQAVALGLDALLPTASGDMAGLLMAMDFDFGVAEIQQTLGQLSPEIYFGFKDTALRTAGLVRGIQEDRAAFLRAGQRPGGDTGGLATWQGLSAGDVVGRGTWSLWARGLGAWSTRGARDGYLGYSADTQGLMAGVDGQLLPWLSLGAHLAYTSSAVDWSSGTAKGNQHGKHAGIFAGAEYAGFYADAAFNFGWLENRATRPIVLPNQSTRAQADFDILTFQSSLTLGYDVVLGSWSFGPMASLTHLALHQERIRETEAGFLNLRLDNLRYTRTSTFIGGRVAGSRDLGGVILQPHLRLGWRHHLDQDRARLTAIFQDYPGAPMPLNEVKPGSDALIAKAGFTLLAGDYFTAGLDYALEHGMDGSSHSVGLELGLRF